MDGIRCRSRRPRLLLINPRFNESFWSFRWAVREILSGKRAINPPLGLATLAALCPPDWEVQIIDENIEAVPLHPEADAVGVCGMGAQHRRQAELLCHFRGQGYHTIAGGSYASLCPERYAGLADTVVSGEAEYIWKAFCRDFTAGQPRPLYRETGTVALADSPVPRFDLLKLGSYTTATLQFSRGCPYRCEFCDIIVMFGRRPRWKTLPQVERELDALRALHARNVFFVDDNLSGHKAVARELLRFLRDYQVRHGYRFSFGTEASINLAQDGELMQLMREAHFEWVFVGIESPDEQTLRETRKTQNTHEDVLTSVRRIFAAERHDDRGDARGHRLRDDAEAPVADDRRALGQHVAVRHEPLDPDVPATCQPCSVIGVGQGEPRLSVGWRRGETDQSHSGGERETADEAGHHDGVLSG